MDGSPITKADAQKLVDEWFYWRSFWNTVHYTTGSVSAFLSVILAANAGSALNGVSAINGAKGFIHPIVATIIAGIAAVFTFILTVTKPSDKADGYEEAARYLHGELLKGTAPPGDAAYEANKLLR